MRRLLVGGAVVGALVLTPAAAGWDFRMPGHSVYCRVEFPSQGVAFRCVRSSNGFWIGFDDVSRRVRVTKGSAQRFRGVRDRRAFLLSRGRTWASSDARMVTCWHFPRGVTCKAYSGPSFWLGRTSGYRIFRDRPGYRPHVRPLFRTSFGIRCGIARDVLEHLGEVLQCWRARDGRELTLAPGGAYASVRPKARGFRPRGFRPLRARDAFMWRLPKRGAVFTCRNDGLRLSCRNRGGHGFWITARRFRAF